MNLLRTTTAIAAAALVAAATVPASAAPPAAQSAARQYEGTVVGKDAASRTFRLRDTERGTIRIKVTRNTRYERVNGFAGLRVGATNIESTVRRGNGKWVAIEVERSGGGGEHGGNNNGDDD